MTRALHFALYSDSVNEAQWRVTAAPGPDNGLHLTVVGVPDDVADASIARHLNDTVVMLPARGAGRALHFDELGRGRTINLYAGRA